MIPDGSGGSILFLEILADGTCWIGDARQSAHTTSSRRLKRQLERKLPDSAARAVVAAVLSAQPNFDQFQPPQWTPAISSGASYGALEMRAFLQTLEETENLFYCSDLLDSALVADYLGKAGVRAPRTRALAAFLRDAGFVHLGQITIGRMKRSLWSRNPTQFCYDDGHVDTDKIRDFLDDL